MWTEHGVEGGRVEIGIEKKPRRNVSVIAKHTAGSSGSLHPSGNCQRGVTRLCASKQLVRRGRCIADFGPDDQDLRLVSTREPLRLTCWSVTWFMFRETEFSMAASFSPKQLSGSVDGMFGPCSVLSVLRQLHVSCRRRNPP